MKALFYRWLFVAGKLYARYSPIRRGRVYLACVLSRSLKHLSGMGTATSRVHQSSYPLQYKYRINSTVGIWLEFFGQWEEGHLARAIEFLRSRSGERRVVLDIGANYGLFSVATCLHVDRCHAYAFECVPAIRSLLEENVELNR